MILASVCVISLFILVESSCHISESGIYRQFNTVVDPSFICFNGAQFSGSIQFQVAFSAIPKIMLNTISYTYDKDAQYRFNILTITTNQWTFSFGCFHSSAKVQKYEFSWIAVLDDRILVINDYMATTTFITGFKTEYLYQTSNVATQLVSYFGGAIALQIFPSGNKIGIEVVEGTSGLGVQIMACQTSCFSMLQGYSSRGFTDTNSIIIREDPSIFTFYNLYFMMDLYSTTFRELEFVDSTLANGSKELSVSGQGGGFYNFYTLTYSIISVQPHYYQKIRVSKKRNQDYNNYIQFTYQQLNLTQHKVTYQDVSSAQFDGFQGDQLTFIYQYRCQPGYKIIGNVLTLADTYFTFVQFCNKSFDLLTIYIYLYEGSKGNRNLVFELDKLGVKIQEIIDPIPPTCLINTYTLVTIEIKKQ